MASPSDVAATHSEAREARTYTAGTVPGSSAADGVCRALPRLTRRRKDERATHRYRSGLADPVTRTGPLTAMAATLCSWMQMLATI